MHKGCSFVPFVGKKQLKQKNKHIEHNINNYII